MFGKTSPYGWGKFFFAAGSGRCGIAHAYNIESIKPDTVNKSKFTRKKEYVAIMMNITTNDNKGLIGRLVKPGRLYRC